MAQNPNPNKSNKHALRDAQARHQSALFSGQAQKPSSQQAETESRQRGQALNQAAAQKRQQLTPEEAQKLAELQAKSRSGGQAAQPAPAQAPAAPPGQRAAQLHNASRRNDLAAAALNNMQRNLKANTPPAPAAQPSTGPQPAQPQAQPQPAQPQPQAQPQPRGSRPAPNPEELDRLLREMAQRSAARRAAGGQAPRPAGGRPSMPGRPGMPGAERGESMPTAEAPPEPAPEIAAEEEKSVEKQAEILRELKAREATAQRDITPIPQADQERAEERAVEATVPIHTEGNAVSAAPLHAAIAHLQDAMRAHDAPGQVSGVNVVQRNMPNHPLYEGNHGT